MRLSRAAVAIASLARPSRARLRQRGDGGRESEMGYRKMRRGLQPGAPVNEHPARARGKRLGRRPGQRPKSDRLAPKVLAAVEEGRSYRWIARDLGISKNTVADIVKRSRSDP